MDKHMIEGFPNQRERQKDFKCSLGFAMTVIGSKWRAIILWHILKDYPIRYGQLKSSVPNISHKVLSQELKNLEMDSLIERIAYATIPPKVEYTPTVRGKSLENVLAELCLWGKKYMDSH
jgi:DNA-binding HxlR family transcriptional regulator